MRILNSSLARSFAIAVGLTLGSASFFGAQAAFIDINFGLLAQNQGEGSVTTQTYTGIEANGYNLLQISSDGYMDAYSGGRAAGLGACVTDGQCSPSSDDNLSTDSVTGAVDSITISLASGGTFNWTVTAFRDDNHYGVAGSDTLLVGTDSGALVSTTFGDELNMIYTAISSITYSYGGGTPDAYYLEIAGVEIPPLTNTEVPEPGGLIILGLGLAGLGFARRKRAA
jgi:hypothetical protein